MNSAEEFIAEIFASEEYRIALRARLIAGTARQGELEIARGLGLIKTDEEQSREYKAKLRALQARAPHEFSMLNRLTRRLDGDDVTGSRPVMHPSTHMVIGLVFDTPSEMRPSDRDRLPTILDPQVRSIPSPSAEPASEDETDLMPPKRA